MTTAVEVAQGPARARRATAVLVAVAAGLVLLPVPVLGSGDEAFVAGAVAGLFGGILLWLTRNLCVKISAPAQADGNTLRCRTVTGLRTLTVAEVRRVTAWRETRRSGLFDTCLVVTDSAGTRIGFYAEDDAMRHVKRAVAAQVRRRASGTSAVRCSRLALDALGVRPLSGFGRFLRSLAAFGRAMTYMVAGAAVPVVLAAA
ncbi:hypothetical protein [Streptomyces sp. NPDC050264]|uniref:hypothetical protein n=1 Tax=Streptomyces sp. NPDC050264 TaxID=3155038 RepID=UPI003413CBF0